MAITDPIADMLTRMRNALTIRQETVMIHVSNIKVGILQIVLHQHEVCAEIEIFIPLIGSFNL